MAGLFCALPARQAGSSALLSSCPPRCRKSAWAAAQPAGTFSKEHSIYMGLIYPVTIALVCYFIGSALMKDVRNVKLMDDQPSAAA